MLLFAFPALLPGRAPAAEASRVGRQLPARELLARVRTHLELAKLRRAWLVELELRVQHRTAELVQTTKDLEDRAEKMADQIQKRLATFADKAEDIEHNDIAKELYALAKSL